MKIKTNELTGAALDWAVAKIEFPEPDYEDADRLVYVHGDDEFHFSPSTNWAQGGPIIEREYIDLQCLPHKDGGLVWRTFHADGPTPLIAAMRCYVASKLGDEIEVPNELTN